jgi:hypothetical protein
MMAYATAVGAPLYHGKRIMDFGQGVPWRQHLRMLAPCVSRGTC